MILNVAFDYGGRCDIVEATKVISGRIVNNDISIDEITEEYLQQELFVKTNVDLLIRTSGELRVSNFLLWQMAYAEFYFTKCLWPDFNEKELLKAISSFQKRKRRFGGLNREVKK
jgi:undecaprenyl diphosphate synthase